MKMCDGHGAISHDEIVFDCYTCPLCEALKDLTEQEKEVEKIGKEASYEVEQLKNRVEQLESENEHLRRGTDPAIEQKSW